MDTNHLERLIDLAIQANALGSAKDLLNALAPVDSTDVEAREEYAFILAHQGSIDKLAEDLPDLALNGYAVMRRDKFLAEADLSFLRKDQVWEYILEAEHQDGYTYWLQFDTPADVAADMRLYYDNLTQDK